MNDQRTYAIRFEMKGGQIVKAELQDVAKVGAASMKTLSERVKDTAKSFTTLKGLSSALGTLMNPVKWLTAGVGVLGTAIGWLTNNTADWAGELKDGAQQANLTTQSFQELRYVCTQVGIEFGTLTSSANKFFSQADEFVRSGGGAAAGAFRELGLSQKQVNDGLADGEKLLLDVIERMRGLDQATQINMAQKMFGKEGGKEFLKLIAETGGKISEIREEARRLGLVLSTDMIEKADEAGDKLSGMAYILKTKVRVALVENSEAIIELVDAIAKNLPTAIEHILEFGRAVGLISPRAESAESKLNALNLQIERYERLKKQSESGQFRVGGGGDLAKQQEDLARKIADLKAQRDGLSTPVLSEVVPAPRSENYINSGGNKGDSAAEKIKSRIEAMKQEVEIMKVSAREQAALRAEQSLGAEASAEQRRQARELALALYDQNEGIKKAEKALQDYDSAVDSVASSIENELGNALEGNLRTWDDWGKAILNIVADVAKEMASLSFGGGQGSFTKGIAQSIFDAFGLSSPAPAGRATGGPVSAGQVYRINEREAEYFRPETNGRMVPVSSIQQQPSGDLKVTVINNNQSQVTTQAKQAGGDRELLIMIDRATAANVANSSSATGRAIRSVVTPDVTRR